MFVASNGPMACPSQTAGEISRWAADTRYLDNLYEEFGVAVELDGQAAHPVRDTWRDIHRDNASCRSRHRHLALQLGGRHGAGPAEVAAEIARFSGGDGWTGRPTSLRPGCPAPSRRP